MWRTLIIWLACVPATNAATIHTANFTVYAPTEEMANNVAIVAEEWREKSAKIWLDTELPVWRYKCPIHVRVTNGGCGGATTYSFDGDDIKTVEMKVQGKADDIIDAAIPHEVTHLILAAHFKRTVPRWADEGAATMLESESEQLRLIKVLNQTINTNQYIPVSKLLEIKSYPNDPSQTLVMYAEGYSLVDFLVNKESYAVFVSFLEDAHKSNWQTALKKHYKYETIADLERDWKKHVTH